MPIARTFVDWTQPALPAVVDYLLQRYARGDTWDLDQVILVFPGARAGRRALELLVVGAAERHLMLRPPLMGTVGALPEWLYESKRPFASDVVQQLAWVQAIRDIGPDEGGPYIAVFPTADDHDQWLDLAALLERQHRELAADALDFAAVAERGQPLSGASESARWHYLSRVQRRYLANLDQLGLWDRQTARLFAIEHHECRTDKDIVLVATTDMNVAMRRMLDQVADRVTAIVHAPSSWTDRFDEHGCLIPDAWQDVPIHLQSQQIRMVQGPTEQADAVLDALAAYDGRYRADQIVIGVLDEQLVPHLLRRLEQARLGARWMVGKTLRDTGPHRLLAALAAVLRRGRFADFAALVRHPDVEAWLAAHGAGTDWLTLLDQYYREHLPPRVGQGIGGADQHAPLRQIVSLVQDAVQSLAGAPRPVNEWAVPIAGLLSMFYGDRALAPGEPSEYYTLKSLEVLRTALEDLQRIPIPIAPVLTAPQAMEQLLRQVAGTAIPSPHAPHSIELLGWLELPLDTAPALVATSFQEGCVPTSVNSDLFLPDALRRQLELLDNRRRYARDAYALSVVLASRPDVTLITARQSAENDPLLPSRLLFATDPRTMAQRAGEFFRAGAAVESSPRVGRIARVVRARSALQVPKPLRLEQPLTSLSVTAFRSYLACPYRFYLRYVLGLTPMDDAVEELGPDTFGTLIHEVLKELGSDPIHTDTDPAKIRRFLHHALHQYVARHYGSEHLPALAVQVVQAQTRLDAFAAWQATRAAEGWKIKYVETSGGRPPAVLRIDDQATMTLKGRIDRIDYRDGQWAILDYKTGDTAKTPQEVHLRSGQWIDLQLPLYVLLAKTLGITGPLQLGYLVLPKDVAKVGVHMAVWSDAELAQAQAVAIDVARRIYRQEFWPPAYPPPEILTDYAAICQDHAFRPNFERVERREADA